MGPPKQDRDGTFTYADYLTWPDNERWELIKGIAYDMSPAPSTAYKDMDEKLRLYERSGGFGSAPLPEADPGHAG